ncbi:hypothetical protein [Micromonospora maris]|uniref:hypothetical protein n=1 Tax=Micromonospora maris TaxID=1003110 RepID=UPI002E112831|nr:hypothetical protein OG712_15505 [Micromonospora maris]
MRYDRRHSQLIIDIARSLGEHGLSNPQSADVEMRALNGSDDSAAEQRNFKTF